MKKHTTMFLLEVYDRTIYGNKHLFKRRISDSIGNIEDWLHEHAPNWAIVPVEIKCDEYGSGIIHIKGHEESDLFTFYTTEIAMV